MKKHFISKKPGISITLDEIRIQYGLEESRYNNIENKSSILLSFIGLSIALSLLIYEYFKVDPFWLVYFFFGLSATITILLLFPKKYPRPHNPYHEYYKYAKLKPEDLQDKFLLNYINSTEKCFKKNNVLMVMIYLAYLTSAAAIVIMAGSLL